MTEDTVIAVIRSKGVFQFNPLAYRNDKKRKLLKSMMHRGLVTRQKVKPALHNYFLSDAHGQENSKDRPSVRQVHP